MIWYDVAYMIDWCELLTAKVIDRCMDSDDRCIDSDR
jgi:hypothetical protein